MEPIELLLTALRAFAVYALMLVVIRCLGKREVGMFSAFDLLVALMLGEIVDEIIYADVSFAQGMVAILAIALADYATGWLTFVNRKADRLLIGMPTIIIRDGQLQRDGMTQERLNEMDVMMLLRQQSIDDLREVKLGILETDGRLSVIQQDWAEPVQKGDLGGPEAEQKQADTGGQEEPPPDQQTTSERALGQNNKSKSGGED